KYFLAVMTAIALFVSPAHAHLANLAYWTAGAQNQQQLVHQNGQYGCGISGGKLYCWGDVFEIFSRNFVTTPQQIGVRTDWTKAYTAVNDSCGIAGGNLYCWGMNDLGQGGVGNTAQNLTPTMVGSASNWTDISGGQNFSTDACGIAGG